MLVVKPIADKATWEAFVRQFEPQNFLQSWNFGEFNRQLGDQPLYLGVFDGEAQVGAGLFVKTLARRGSYYACAAGPLVVYDGRPLVGSLGVEQSETYQVVLTALMQYLKSLAGGMVFARVRSNLVATDVSQSSFAKAGFKPSPMHLHAEESWLLDLTQSADDILANMRKNTRYYVRRAPKDGVVVEQTTSLDAVEILSQLQAETVARHKFIPFSAGYFQKLFSTFVADNQVAMFVARFEDKSFAAAMINYYGDQAVYHYAASDSEHAKLPGAYAILWEAILEAKRRGCKWFNFWGVVGDEDKDHPWFGLSQFKKGFGGYAVNYLHAQDYALSWKYWLTRVFEVMRKRKRGL